MLNWMKLLGLERLGRWSEAERAGRFEASMSELGVRPFLPGVYGLTLFAVAAFGAAAVYAGRAMGDSDYVAVDLVVRVVPLYSFLNGMTVVGGASLLAHALAFWVLPKLAWRRMARGAGRRPPAEQGWEPADVLGPFVLTGLRRLVGGVALLFGIAVLGAWLPKGPSSGEAQGIWLFTATKCFYLLFALAPTALLFDALYWRAAIAQRPKLETIAAMMVLLTANLYLFVVLPGSRSLAGDPVKKAIGMLAAWFAIVGVYWLLALWSSQWLFARCEAGLLDAHPEEPEDRG